EAFATTIEKWIEDLTLVVSRRRLPHDALLFEPETTRTLAAGTTHSPRQRVVWIIEADGDVQFLGQLKVPSRLSDGAFPVSASGWVEVDQETQVTTLATRSLLGDARLWTGLRRFHERILTGVAANAKLSAEAALHRLANKARAERKLTESSLAQLAAVVSVDGDATVDHGSDPLLAACQLVGQRQGIPITAPKNYTEQNWSDPVDVIAHASAVRIRRVVLSDGWWRRDNGPLLGFLKESGQAVALLPVSKSQYEIVNTESGSRTPVTASAAATLRAFGYTFYRSFPPEPLTARDVFKFGLRGTGRDWTLLGMLGIASGLMGMLIPVATGWVIGKVIPAADQSRLLFVVVALTVAAIVVT
ncbi:MAG: hypothetical protein ACC645_01225, partial [Pirellulales bacterium]